MKNLHIIPTDKPSRLWTNNLRRRFELDEFPEQHPTNIAKHIYITSDEEIKEGDWFMSDFNSFPIHNIKELSEREGTLGWEQNDLKNNLKIILTTDPDLIKDGVQAIDDEFLEWFVKNPSCEEVYIELKDGLCLEKAITIPNSFHKIIIPKEEPKPIHEQIIEHCGGKEKFKEITGLKPKQQTLEEVVEQELENHFFSNISEIKKAKYFINFGIELQQQQDKKMYSEEDIYSLLDFIRNNAVETDEGWQMNKIVYTNEELFEKFKKK
jgi:hypothetical protein